MRLSWCKQEWRQNRLKGVKNFVKLAKLILSDSLRYFEPMQGDATAKYYRFKYILRPYRLLQVNFYTCRVPPIFIKALRMGCAQHVHLRSMEDLYQIEIKEHRYISDLIEFL